MMRLVWRPLAQRVALALLLVGALGGCAAQGPSAQTPPTATSAPTGAAATDTPIPTQVAPATSTPQPGTPSVTVLNCQPAQLIFTIHTGGGAAGHIGQMGQFTNQSSATCSLYGFPGAQMLDAQHNPMPTHALWQTSAYMYTNQMKQLVQLAPGASAYFAVTWSDVTVGSATSCPASAYLSVTPPNDFSVLTVADQINACDSNLEISPVEPTAFMGG
ncbi:MAG TPA: DUF4232 domain-containing protein [Ktedonobacterales bacterium]